jgi:hypothetical protein
MINTNDVAEPKNTNIDLHSSIPEQQVYATLQDLNFATVTDESLKDANIKKYARDLAFMEQKVTFVVQPGSKDESPVLTLGVNGQNVHVTRGQPVRAARKFLNTLFTFTHEMSTEQYVDENGLTQTKVKRKQQPAYPVSLLEDTQEGRNWFAANQRVYYV